jgi:hypothetical protein
MRYEPRCKHKNGYDCDICDKSYEDYKVNFENKKEKYDDKAFEKMPNEHLLSDDEREDVDLDGDNLCPHDKYFKDCDDCLDKEILRLRSLIEEQENIIVDTRIELRKLSKGLQY